MSELIDQDPVSLIQLGLQSGIPAQDYHAWPGVSKSGLDHLAISPAHFQAYLAEPRRETPALTFGRIAHRHVLEGVELAAIPAEINRRTKAGQAEYELFLAENKGQGCEIVSSDDAERLAGMRRAIFAHKAASALLENCPGRPELSAWWLDAETGELCKCRPDWIREDDVILDYKTTEDASPEGFPRFMAKYRYHVQHAFYQDGMRAITGRDFMFAFLVQEKDPPYAVGVYVLDSEAVELGRILYKRNLLTLAECKISKSWPAYSNRVETINLPRWAFKEA